MTNRTSTHSITWLTVAAAGSACAAVVVACAAAAPTPPRPPAPEDPASVLVVSSAPVPPIPKKGEPPALAPDARCKVDCSGSPSQALLSELREAATSSRSCYRRLVRTKNVAGHMTVTVKVLDDGTSCEPSVAYDTTGSSELGDCVRDLFRAQRFPPPESGCLVINLPLVFALTDGGASSP